MNRTEIIFKDIERIESFSAQNILCLLGHDILEQASIIWFEMMINHWVINQSWELLMVRGCICYCWIIHRCVLFLRVGWQLLGNLDTIHFINVFLQPLVSTVLLNIWYNLLLSEEYLVNICGKVVLKLTVITFFALIWIFRHMNIIFTWIVVKNGLFHAFVENTVVSSTSRLEKTRSQ